MYCPRRFWPCLEERLGAWQRTVCSNLCCLWVLLTQMYKNRLTTHGDFISPQPVPVEPAVDEGSLSGHEPSDKLV